MFLFGLGLFKKNTNRSVGVGGGGGVGVVYLLISDLHNLKKSSDTKAYELIVMYCNVLY